MSNGRAIEDLAKQAILADAHDVPALTRIRDGVLSLRSTLDPASPDVVLECLDRTAQLMQRLIAESDLDAEASLDLARRAIDFAQHALAAHESGQPGDRIGASPFAAPAGDAGARAGSTRATRDTSLLRDWLADCAHHLTELEALLIGLEPRAPRPEAREEIGRKLHTLKGECGVLGLDVAYQSIHEAESAIERGLDLGTGMPVDALLLLVDWLRGFTAALSADPGAAAPASEQLLNALNQAPLAPSSEPAPGPGPVGPAEPADAAPREGVPDAPVELVVDPGMVDTISEFLCESREHLSAAEAALLALESTPSDKELIATVFRAFHTIKGVAGFMNLTPVVALAHGAETLLDAVRSDRLALASAHLDLVLRSRDMMMQLLGALAGGEAPSVSRHAALIEQLEVATRGELPAEPAPDAGAARGEDHTGTAPAQPDAPAADAQDDDSKPATDAAARPAPGAAANSATGGAVSGAAAKRSDQTVKVSTLRMDSLVDMVGELVIAHQMVMQDPAAKAFTEPRLQRRLSMVGKIIRDLQEVSMALRMVPIKGTFQRMSRLVRDVAAKTGKRIDLHTEGEDVELDRNVVESIADPLVHMVRNACDHGIEPAEQRRASGKPEGGLIQLRAFHSGGTIVVEIEDDGKGLSRERIIAKALEKGLLDPARPIDKLSDTEVFNMVFLPGFSTAEKVTDLSGRGVGMDVVKRNIEALRGKVEIRSTTGRGTTVSMRLPLTMAIIDGMVVRNAGQRYVIPALSMERTITARDAGIHTIVGRGEVALVRGDLLPVYRLSECLGAEQARTELSGLLLIVEAQGSRACLAVDEIVGQQQVVIKSLGDGAPATRGVSGGAILGDGRVALILDVAGLLASAQARAAHQHQGFDA